MPDRAPPAHGQTDVRVAPLDAAMHEGVRVGDRALHRLGIGAGGRLPVMAIWIAGRPQVGYGDALLPAHGDAVAIEAGFDPAGRRRAVVVVAQVLGPRPDQLDGLAGGAGGQCGLVSRLRPKLPPARVARPSTSASGRPRAAATAARAAPGAWVGAQTATRPGVT